MDEFYALSQITISIAGFAALFSILRTNEQQWTDLDKLNLIRFYIMIETACIISILCFIPILLSGYLEDDITFKISSLALVIINLLY